MGGYGCSGGLDMNAKPLGRPVDDIDLAIFRWRKCNKCAGEQCAYKTNRYNECTNKAGSCGRHSCECDTELFRQLKTAVYVPAHANGNANCQAPKPGSGAAACCKKGQLFQHYNMNTQECCDNREIAPLGR